MEHNNECMKKASAIEARFRSGIKTYSVVPESVRAVQVAFLQAVTLYWSELWWDPREAGRRDDLQHLLNRQDRSILGMLPTTPRGVLMRESGLTLAPVILDSRQQPFAARLENACSRKLPERHKNPSSGAPICRAVRKELEHGRTAQSMNWPTLGEEPVVRTTILDDTTAAKSAAQRWAREKEAKVGAGVWMWCTDGSRSDNGRVGAAAVCQHGNERRYRSSILGTRRIEVFDAELCAMGLPLDVAIEQRETLQKNGVRMVAHIRDLEAAIRRAAHLEPNPGQRLARQIDRRAWSVLAHVIATEVHWVPGHSGIPPNQQADRQANLARDACRSTLLEWPYTLAFYGA